MNLMITFLLITNVFATTSLCRAADETSIPDTLKWYDSNRQRLIPVAIYKNSTIKKIAKPKLVVVSHGYGKNQPNSYLEYSYICNFLSAKGYYVISIQHELATDELLPLTGIPQIVRRPFWERGADNILFVINELKKRGTSIDFSNITLIGHSNGGDMTALFPLKYPNIVRKIITLDNRRMALPLSTDSLKVYSIRSSDQTADEGVLPTEEQLRNYPMSIVKLAATIHNNMDDKGNKTQHKEITQLIYRFIKED